MSFSGAQWRATSRAVINQGTSGEQAQRAAVVQIITNLDTQCQLQDDLWLPRDQDFDEALGRPFRPTRVTRVPRERVYVGSQPSLVESRFDLWPAITVRTGPRAPTDAQGQPDQYDSYDVTLIVEVLARAGPFEGVDVMDSHWPAEVVDRQAQRLSDAVIGCIDVDRSLGGNFLRIQGPPRWNPSLAFTRPEAQGVGADVIFQAVELTYTLQTLSY